MTESRMSLARVAIAGWFALFSIAAFAQSSDVRVSGTLSGGGSTITFTCFGMPTCTGIYTETGHEVGCSNAFTGTETVVINGLDLSHPGTIQGNVIPTDLSTNFTRHPDGTCTYMLMPRGTSIHPYTATWDGRTGYMTVMPPAGDSGGTTFSGAFTAALPAATPPVFPMTVTPNITPTTASATAQIQPRAQDVGTTASVFVFAQAPSNIVIGAAQLKRASASPPVGARSDDAIVCVLAQVNSSGQLVAVSASTMQAYITGVLTAQSQAIELLRNVPIPNVAGAAIFVGYGPNAAAMLSSGVFQTAISIPGGVQCTSSLSSAPAATMPGARSGLWWNANESGWGIHFTQRGSNTFAAWYTYDGAGKPKWYVSTCAGASGISGICNGTLYEVVGPSFFGGSFNPSLVNAVNAGSLQVDFRDVNNASMTYVGVSGQTRTVALVRQPLATGTTPPAVDYTDLWWSPSESGWGMAVTQQFGITFLAWYVYDANGRPTWLVATCPMSGSTCSGTLYQTTGPAFGTPFDASQVHNSAVGTAIVSFIDANNAIVSYTVNGLAGTKTITRQLF
jgi:hypothetical protein